MTFFVNMMWKQAPQGLAWRLTVKNPFMVCLRKLQIISIRTLHRLAYSKS